MDAGDDVPVAPFVHCADVRFRHAGHCASDDDGPVGPPLILGGEC